MTHDRTKMPPDELMGKVVAEWKGVDVPFMVTTSTVGKGITALVPIGRADVEVVDPRFDTDAALELLHWLVQNHAMCVFKDPNAWKICDLDGCASVLLPISGEPFRRAVCWLAVQLLGIDETLTTVDAPIDEFSWCKVRTPGTPGCSIQWKGTDVCVDLYCPCGHDSNFVGQFLYAWQCPSCKKVWEMGDEVKMREVHHHSCMQEIIEHD